MQGKVEYKINKDEFIIENYNQAKPFASFFPAIAGLWGKPLWAFYVNRGQAISCMGSKDKNGAIMEFLAANKAYRQTALQGFRTFIKINNRLYEPFKNNGLTLTKNIEQRMHITPYLVKLVETNQELGLEISVNYFTVPNENVPALARTLSIKNLSGKAAKIECIDGLPMLVPYGTSDFLLKNMSRLAEGWFSGVIFVGKNKIPVYKLMVEPEDRPEIVKIESGNFYAGLYLGANGKLIFPEFIIDPDVVFGETKDFTSPTEFIKNSKLKNPQGPSAKNKTPSGMGYFRTTIKGKKTFTYYSVVGNAANMSILKTFLKKLTKKDYFEGKQKENKNIIRGLENNILTKTSSEEFDNYCQHTYLDNLLRGGIPLLLGSGKKKKNHYAYSRIHGDMEREYNNFVILPEYFSQGNGAYRDVNQNRRNDIFFNQEIKDETLVYFINLIQVDGFNPLGIIGSKFKVEDKKAFLSLFGKKDKNKINDFIASPFSLGAFFGFLEKENIKTTVKREKLLDKLIACSRKIDYAAPGHGYWSDHWHYNLDLLESFLSIYPEELEAVLFKKKIFTFYDNPLTVVPRKEKYVLYNRQPRQMGAVQLNEAKEKMLEARKSEPNVMRSKYGKGAIYKTTLIGKLLSLVSNKYASLDIGSIGVEMESGKPNWCDALNGLPGLFGSSTAESLELKRFIEFILDSLGKDKEIKTAKEIIDFFRELRKITVRHSRDNYTFWDKTHTVKENYREKTTFGFSGQEKSITTKELKETLELFLARVKKGLNKAYDKKTGVVRTNYENEVTKYRIIKENGKILKNADNLTCIKALKFKQKPLPLFLEGPVHYLRINKDEKKARAFHGKVLKSDLYDKKLKMFKVNASLDKASINLGRIKVFTPGWLENESIWLHMEYKYLFELLRNGLAEEFYQLMKSALVPFMDPSVYGRSIFENVSFLASSAHPEKGLHGQGFVARLSGATAEFISIWLSITSGLKPFYLDKNKLCLEFKPQISSGMFTTKKDKVTIYYSNSKAEEIILPENAFLFKFLGKTAVIYRNPLRKNTYGKNKAKVSKIKIVYFSGKESKINGAVIHAPHSYDIRGGDVKRIEITLK